MGHEIIERIVCDRCKDTHEEPAPAPIDPNSGPVPAPAGWVTMADGNGVEWMLCPECDDGLMKWLGTEVHACPGCGGMFKYLERHIKKMHPVLTVAQAAS